MAVPSVLVACRLVVFLNDLVREFRTGDEESVQVAGTCRTFPIAPTAAARRKGVDERTPSNVGVRFSKV